MENTLTELWYGNVYPHEQATRQDEEAKDLVKLVEKNRRELAAIMEQQIFRYGFRLGGRLMLETLTDTSAE